MGEQGEHEIAVIILAAGSSSRMGESKQLIAIQGETLLGKSVRVALQSKSKNIVVVLGAHEADHRTVLSKFPVSIRYNPHWERGMGSSLKAGLDHLKSAKTNPEGVIIMVCDQPLLTASHLGALIEHYYSVRKPIVASGYSGSIGVPVLFDTSMFGKLSELEDGQGAKKIIESSKEFVDVVQFPEGSVDLDTPEDVTKFLGR